MALSTSPLYGGGYDVWDPFDLRTSWPWDTGRWWRGGADDETTALAGAHVDWRETGNAHIFTAEIPGARKEDVRVQVVDRNVLEISGERTKEEENVGDTWHRVERRRGSFQRRFRLPANANLDDIKCSMENGVLRVVVPKVTTHPKVTSGSSTSPERGGERQSLPPSTASAFNGGGGCNSGRAAARCEQLSKLRWL